MKGTTDMGEQADLDVQLADGRDIVDSTVCPLTELSKASCAHCRGIKSAEEEAESLDKDFFESDWFK